MAYKLDAGIITTGVAVDVHPVGVPV